MPTARNYIKDLMELTQHHVHIKDAEHVNRVIEEITNGGFGRLQIVSDFDLTITKQHENGKPHMSSFNIFGRCPSVTDEFLTTSNALYRKYFPIEFDPHIEAEEKRLHMVEWYNKSEEALRGLKVPPEEIEGMVEKLGPSLRNGSRELFRYLAEQNVPVLVFSAGLGDSVVAVLKHYGVYLSNVKVISNFLEYSRDDGTIVGFKGDHIIHVLNKNEISLKGSEYFDLIANRDHVIVLGDSIGDARMADGITNTNHVLKIGFLYENVSTNLPLYMDNFDIVLEDDQTMDVVMAIIKQIAL